MGLIRDLRQEAQNIMDSGVVQRNAHETPAAAKQIGKADGMRRVCNAVEHHVSDLLGRLARGEMGHEAFVQKLNEMFQ